MLLRLLEAKDRSPDNKLYNITSIMIHSGSTGFAVIHRLSDGFSILFIPLNLLAHAAIHVVESIVSGYSAIGAFTAHEEVHVRGREDLHNTSFFMRAARTAVCWISSLQPACRIKRLRVRSTTVHPKFVDPTFLNGSRKGRTRTLGFQFFRIEFSLNDRVSFAKLLLGRGMGHLCRQVHIFLVTEEVIPPCAGRWLVSKYTPCARSGMAKRPPTGSASRREPHIWCSRAISSGTIITAKASVFIAKITRAPSLNRCDGRS